MMFSRRPGHWSCSLNRLAAEYATLNYLSPHLEEQ